MARITKQLEYEYSNMPIPGGGYVTGFIYHEKCPGVFYLRTDIGGVYKFDAVNKKWISLIDHVTQERLDETFPLAIALDDNNPKRLYIASGIYQKEHGLLSVSEDAGESFEYYEMPCMVHGNLPGRGTGFKLIVDKNDENTLWYASQEEGLFKSEDRGKTWKSITSIAEKYLSFVGQIPLKNGSYALIVSSAGVTTKRSDTLRGHSLYVSYDNGNTFEELWQPEDNEIDGCKFAGRVGARYTYDDKYLYITLSITGKNAWTILHGYSCDAGACIGGTVLRYEINNDSLGKGEDITPKGIDEIEAGIIGAGFAGLCTAKSCPGLVVASTINQGDYKDSIYRSFDYGNTWELILQDLAIGKMDFKTSYMKPKYNDGKSIIHWLTDLKINPFDENELWFNTGTGVFRTKNLTDKECVVFSDHCDGIEETVHLNLYAPPAGEVKLIDILGDLGGFAFREYDKPCDNSFDDEDGNRYITCINADYCDNNPQRVIVTPRGNWRSKTLGGLILSNDQCETFRRLPMPFGINSEIDDVLHEIERPNVNSGWVAMSADGKSIVWSLARGIELPVKLCLVSNDGGESFRPVKVYDLNGKEVLEGGFKVFSDRMDENLFYGFGDASEIYISTDKGNSFKQVAIDSEVKVPKIKFTLIDCANKTELRGVAGKTGEFYFVAKENGLWRVNFDAKELKVKFTKLSNDIDVFFRMGIGIGPDDNDYITGKKGLYVSANINGEYGFYRTFDEGETFERLNTSKQMFGEIYTLDADKREFGRFYLGTGSRGVITGKQVEK